MRNIVVFERIYEGANGEEITELDWRLKGQALPAHSCPVAMVNEGKVMQWEAREFDRNTVTQFVALQAELEGYWANNASGTEYRIVEGVARIG